LSVKEATEDYLLLLNILCVA